MNKTQQVGTQENLSESLSRTEVMSIRDAMSFALMSGAGEAYLSAFGIFLKGSTLQIGILSSIPQFIGAIFQMLGVKILERLKDRRKYIVSAALVQALLWVPLAFVPGMFYPSPTAPFVLLALIVVYYGVGGTITPIWNSFIGDSVPQTRRGRFFGLRNARAGFVTFCAVVCAGGILEWATRQGQTLWGYTAIFLLALLGRLLSVLWLSRHDNPEYHHRPEAYFSFYQFLKKAPRSNFAIFVFYVAMINFAVAFSGPYFSLYMLRDLHLSYWQFTTVIATSTLSQFVTLQRWGPLTDTYGSKRILNICGWGISFAPVLWLFSSELWYLMLVQIFAGLVWSGFMLATTTFMFDAVTPAKRARCAAYHALISGAFYVAGSTAGAYTEMHLPYWFETIAPEWKPHSWLLGIFLLSSVMRFFITLFFIKRFREVREVKKAVTRDLMFRMTYLRPLGGAGFTAVGEWFEKKLQKKIE